MNHIDTLEQHAGPGEVLHGDLLVAPHGVIVGVGHQADAELARQPAHESWQVTVLLCWYLLGAHARHPGGLVVALRVPGPELPHRVHLGGGVALPGHLVVVILASITD